MSKLFARAQTKYANAENNYLRIGEDDAFLDETCFNLQQCIELCLKYLVEMSGEEYIETHDIRAQINKLRSLNAVIPCEQDLRKMATTLNSWEAESRYNDNFTALIDDIEDARNIAEELIIYCRGIVKEI